MKMYIDGAWAESAKTVPVISPFSSEQIDTIPDAMPEQVEAALAAAARGAEAMARLTGYERNRILNRAADLCAAHQEELARTISEEMGKPLTEARGEASRGADILRLSAFEGTQLRGETLPLDANVNTRGKMGFTQRIPCGVVVAITPFNYPLLLVLHKIGPALATGNSVILKPTNQAPLTALKLTKLLLEAGLPADGLQCITGSGSRIGPALCADARVRKISFTGSTGVGEQIAKVAGVKKLSLELGSNAPLIVMPDANLEQVAAATSTGGYVNAGQVCISLQRVLVDRRIYADYLDAVRKPVEAIKVGPSLADDTQLSAMISAQEADRVGRWIEEAVTGGARLITGGQHEGAVFQPTVLADVRPEMRVFREEIFGPAITVTPVEGIDEAIRLANDSSYGLVASIFTRDLINAMRFSREVQSGMVHINWTPLWRADLMPYGGVKGSGIGREGMRYAAEEMTEIKTTIVHGLE